MRRCFPELLLILALVGTTLAALGRVVGHDFVNLDDEVYVTGNPMVRDGLTETTILWAWTTFYAANWHPLTWMSLQLDAWLGEKFDAGLHPAVFHATNLAWHTVNVVLLFWLLRTTTRAFWKSGLAAALFAVHPLHVESVAWVAERKDVLSTCLFLLTLLLYVSYARRPGPGRLMLTLLAFALGLLAKPMLVTLPCVLLLLDYWPLQRWGQAGDLFCSPRPLSTGGEGRKRSFAWPLIAEKLPFFALAALSCAITLLAQDNAGAVQSLQTFSGTARLANALVAYVGYLGQTVWPLDLAVFYPHPGDGISPAQAVGAGLLLALITAAALGSARRRPYLAVGWLWFLGTLVPVIGLVQVGDQALADRYTYVPLIGIFVLAVWGLADLLDVWRCPAPVRVGLAVLLVVVCGFLSGLQAGHWRNTDALWEHAARVTSWNYRAHASLGYSYQGQGRLEEAEPHLRTALAIHDGDLQLHALLAQTLLRLHRDEDAREAFETIVRKDPGNAEGHFGLGLLSLRAGQVEEARSHLARAVRFSPVHVQAQTELGWLHLQQGNDGEASVCFQFALRYNHRHGRAHLGQGWVYFRQGKTDQSIHHLAQAARRGEDLTQLLLLDGAGGPEMLDVLASALAAAGQTEQAIATARKALAQARSAGRADLAEQIEQRLHLYLQRRPPSSTPEAER